MKKILPFIIGVIITYGIALSLFFLSVDPFLRIKFTAFLLIAFLIAGVFCRFLLGVLFEGRIRAINPLWSMIIPSLCFISGYFFIVIKSLIL